MIIRVTNVEWTWLGLVCCRELSTDEMVDAALGTNYAQNFDLNIDLH